MTDTAVVLRVRDQTLVLHPERAVEWRERATVVVADTHFGKGSLFRRHGLAVPAGSDDHDRTRLTALLRRVGARHLIVLGDFLHAPLEKDCEDARAIDGWSDALQPLRVHVVAGNHDRGAWVKWQPAVRWLDADWIDGPFRFTHDAAKAPASGHFTLSGHVHPVVRLSGMRKRSARVPVFWHRENGLVLPSFGLFTGGCVIAPAPGERVFAVGPERVVPYPGSRKCP